MPPKTVVSLLQQQSEETLIEMRDAMRAEIARLEIEARLVEEALSKRYRRGSRTTHSNLSEPNGRSRILKRRDVYDLVQSLGRPVSPAETRALFADKGIHVSGNSIRNHLARLVTDKKLNTDGEGLYYLPGQGPNGSDERDNASQTEFRDIPVPNRDS